MDLKTKSIVFYAVLICVGVLLWVVVHNSPGSMKATYSEFLQQVQSGQVNSAVIVAANTGTDQVTYRLKNGTELQTVIPAALHNVLDAMQQNKVEIEIKDASTQWLRVLANSSPFLLLLGFWFYAMRHLSNRAAK